MRAKAARTLITLTLAAAPAAAGDFASAVAGYAPAPGQRVGDPAFNDPARALGPPAGEGTTLGNATSVVTLGGFGGSITLAFDETVRDDPRNPLGLDAIVFGNAFWQSLDGGLTGESTARFAEAGVIEISSDANGNGLPDDPWYVIPGSSLPDPPSSAFRTMTWPDAPDSSGYELPAEFTPPPPFFLLNPDAPAEAHRGYADCSPTLRLGDYSGATGAASDNELTQPEDDPAVDPGAFYTVPDDPALVGVDPRAAGGDAFDIASAVDPDTGAPANLTGFDFIRIRTGVSASLGPLGEISTEIDAVADVRPAGDFDGDDVVNSDDLGALLAAWGRPGGLFDLTADGAVDSADLGVLLASWGPVPQ